MSVPLEECPINSYGIAEVEFSEALQRMYPKLSKTRQLTICDYLYHLYQQMLDEVCDVIVDINKHGEGRPLPEGVSDPGELDTDSEEDVLTVTILGCSENEEKKKLLKKAASYGCEWAKLISKNVMLRKFEGKVIYEFKR